MTKMLSICAMLLLAGCAKTDRPPRVEPLNVEVQRYEVGAYYVREFRLSDGTRCVAMIDTGIQCDWQPQKVEL
jgi:outer membrane biogenesis lipoprotein LolB